jgi:hypothetical protein
MSRPNREVLAIYDPSELNPAPETRPSPEDFRKNISVGVSAVLRLYRKGLTRIETIPNNGDKIR